MFSEPCVLELERALQGLKKTLMTVFKEKNFICKFKTNYLKKTFAGSGFNITLDSDSAHVWNQIQ
jgi:hypothetical protein